MMGRSSGQSGTQGPEGFALFVDGAGSPCSALGLSHRSRAGFPAALASTEPRLPDPSPARSIAALNTVAVSMQVRVE